jgi:hypothetical protein
MITKNDITHIPAISIGLTLVTDRQSMKQTYHESFQYFESKL